MVRTKLFLLLTVLATTVSGQDCADSCADLPPTYPPVQGPNDCPNNLTYNSNCNSRCACPADNQVYQLGMCGISAGSVCDTTPCTDGATCEGPRNRCECTAAGRTENTKSGRCPAPKNEKCIVGSDCDMSVGLDCIEETCACTPTSYGTPGPCFKTFDSGCVVDGDCNWVTPKGLVCLNSTCQCPEGKNLHFNPNYDPRNPPNMWPMSQASMQTMLPTPATEMGRCEIAIGLRCCQSTSPSCADMICNDKNRCECRQYAKYDSKLEKCVCGANTYRYPGSCDCLPGTTRDGNNVDCSCPIGMEWSEMHQSCRQICGLRTNKYSGYCECLGGAIRDPNGIDCSCIPPMEWNPTNEICLAPQGSVACPAGSYIFAGTCIPGSCPYGTFAHEGACPCKAGYHLYNFSTGECTM